MPELQNVKAEMSYSREEGGKSLPDGIPALIDAHVHVFPTGIFNAVRKWFDTHAWSVRYRMDTKGIFEFLLSRGVQHIVALQYAHKPGMAKLLNEYMAEKCQQFPGRITGLATVFPGEDRAREILQQAFDSGLGGVKLHAHVQCFDMNDHCMTPVYECCLKNEKPILMHVGREPNSPAYACDPYTLCSADKLERVLTDFPGLKICVPHLGFDEIQAYADLIEKYDTLWLDTAMVLADYFPVENRIGLDQYRSDRIMYGSDFPNIPFAWDRELKTLTGMDLDPNALEKITRSNARAFFNID